MIFKISPSAVKITIYSFGIISLGWFVMRIYIIKKGAPLNLNSINSDIQKEFPEISDRLVNTLSLWKDRFKFKNIVAESIIKKLLDETLGILKSVPSNVLPLKVFYRHLFLFTVAVLLFVVLFHIKPPPFIKAVAVIKKSLVEKQNNYINVFPGDTSVKKGDKVSVKVLTNTKNQPQIEIFRLNQNYKENLIKISEEQYVFEITDIRESLKYRCTACKGRLKSKWYVVKVKSPPVVRKITLTYIYPSYTGFENKTSFDTQIEGLQGTTVIIDVESSKPLRDAVICMDKPCASMDRLDKFELLSTGTACGKLILDKQTFYQILLEDTDGLKEENPPQYSIRVLNDEPPCVEIVSPHGDIQVSPEAFVEVIGKATDDVGLKNIYITYHIDIAGSGKKVPVKVLSEPVKSKKFSYIWDISKTDVLPGNIITYRIAARDNNTLYGCQVGYSEKMHLEIIGFRDKHNEILKNAALVEEKIFSMLSDTYEITSQLEGHNFKEAIKEIDSISDKSAELEEFIKQLLKDMESDPYMEKSTIDEYRGLNNSFNYLNKKTIPQLKSMTEKSKAEAVDKSKELSRQLERMMRLSEDIAKREKMNDVLNSASESLQKVRDLSDMLHSKDITPKDIQKKIEKIAHLLNELKKAMMDFPEDLPEEFINQESVKDLDFTRMPEQFSELQKALNSGDMARAREILNQMIKSMQNIMETLQNAAGESHSGRRTKLLKRTEQLNEELKFIIEKQKELIENTGVLRDFVETERNIYEKKRFKELKDKYSILKSTTGLRLRKIDKEFRKGYLFRAPELLEKLIPELKAEWKKEKVTEFLNELQHKVADESFLSGEQKSRLRSMCGKQGSLKENVYNVREGISTLGHLTALLDMELLENLDLAGLYMGYAARSLGGISPSEALPHERQALSYLIQTGKEMEQFSGKLQAIPQSLDVKGSRSLHQYTFSGTTGGRTGFREGYVEIPSPGAAQGGREFRKMILEALKENHPEEYRKLIREYFRSLSE